MCYIGSQGMIWWWIFLSASCHLSNSPQEMSTAREHKIESLKPAHFRVLMSPNIPFTLTMAYTYSFTMLPYSSANTRGIPHYWFTRCAPCSLTKGHGIVSNPPHFVSFLHHNWGASYEVWQAEVDYLSIHFAGESEKWEHMEQYEESLAFRLHF